LIIPTIDPYVPAIVKRHPARTMKLLQQTFNHQLSGLPDVPEPQLSYSHIHPKGWKHIGVPNRAPTNETRLLKTGIPLAIT
jgi:hypothetical protein